MFTQCPQCRTVFRVTAPMIKAAQGRVRCGRCSYVFNALTFFIERDGSGLADEDEDESAALIAGDAGLEGDDPADIEAEAANEGAVDPAQAAGEIVGEDVEEIVMDDSGSMVGDDVEEIVIDETGAAVSSASASDDEDIPDSALEFTASDLSQVFVEEDAPVLPDFEHPHAERRAAARSEIGDVDLESPESIMLEGDSVIIVESDELAPSTLPGEAAAAAAREGESIPDAETRREIEAAFAADPTTRAEFVLPSGKRLIMGPAGLDPDPTTDVEATEQLQRETERQRKIHRWWTAASAIFGVLLAIQIVHHNRQALLGTAAVGPILSRLYGSLGAELSPAWNVHAYEVRQSGAAADPSASGTLRVRASLMNGADHAQPFPLLRLTLQDRFGARIGLRDVEPRDYLSVPPRRDELLGAGQRIDAEIDIVDPGKDAVGFEIDVCLRDKTAVTCANEGTHQAG